MKQEFFSLADRIRMIRESHDMTQSQLAKELHITRSAVNGWEMGLSVPSTQCIVEIAKLFNISTDYLLGMEHGAVLDIDGLNNNEVSILISLVKCLKAKDNDTK